VADGSALVAPPFPRSDVVDGVTKVSGFIALLEVRGDPATVLHDYLDQFVAGRAPVVCALYRGVQTCSAAARREDAGGPHGLMLTSWRGRAGQARPVSPMQLAFGDDAGTPNRTEQTSPVPPVPEGIVSDGSERRVFDAVPHIGPVPIAERSRLVAEIVPPFGGGMAVFEVRGEYD
jgi:hypothetical protein